MRLYRHERLQPNESLQQLQVRTYMRQWVGRDCLQLQRGQKIKRSLTACRRLRPAFMPFIEVCVPWIGTAIDPGALYQGFEVGDFCNAGSPGARQRNVTSKTPWSALEPILVELLKTRSCLESCAHCWRAADIAASLAGSVPPLDVRDDNL